MAEWKRCDWTAPAGYTVERYELQLRHIRLRVDRRQDGRWVGSRGNGCESKPYATREEAARATVGNARRALKRMQLDIEHDLAALAEETTE